jgi:hypothetical protein
MQAAITTVILVCIAASGSEFAAARSRQDDEDGRTDKTQGDRARRIIGSSLPRGRAGMRYAVSMTLRRAMRRGATRSC